MAGARNLALLKPARWSYIEAIKTKGENEMKIRQRLANFANYQRTLRELNALDNRQLDDLGITRGDIQNVARGKAF